MAGRAARAAPVPPPFVPASPPFVPAVTPAVPAVTPAVPRSARRSARRARLVRLAARDDQHPDRGAVLGLVGHLLRAHRGHIDAARSARPLPHLATAPVIVLDDHGRGVIRVAEPGLMTALGPLADPADAAQAGQRHRSRLLAGGQVVHGDLADRVARPPGQQEGPAQFGSVQDRVAAQHGISALADEIPPARRTRAGRIGNREPAARRVQIGVHVQAPVPADPQAGPGVDALLHHPQLGRGLVGCGQVGQPQVVARRGADRGRDDEPAPVPAHLHAVVAGLLPARTEDHHVLGGRDADPVQVDATVVLLLALGHRLGGQPPHVVERLAGRSPAAARAGQPGHPGVTAAIDRPIHVLPGGHVHDPQHGLLVAALGELVGQQLALLVRLPRVQRGDPRRVDAHRVDEHALRRGRGVLGGAGTGRQQHGVILIGRAAHEELPVAAPGRRADRARPHELGDPRRHDVAARKRRGVLGEQRILRRLPGARFGQVGIFEPAVRIQHHVAEDLVGDFEPGGVGVAQFGHGRHPSGGSSRRSMAYDRQRIGPLRAIATPRIPACHPGIPACRPGVPGWHSGGSARRPDCFAPRGRPQRGLYGGGSPSQPTH